MHKPGIGEVRALKVENPTFALRTGKVEKEENQVSKFDKVSFTFQTKNQKSRRIESAKILFRKSISRLSLSETGIRNR